MKKELKLIDKYWNALNYLSVGQLYLLDNPLLKEELKLKDIKKILVGHWGTAPGQNFIYAHLNRVIKENNLNMIYISGPGHGGQAMIANSYLEGSYTKCYPEITEDEEGMKKLFKQFSFPGGVSSHVSPEVPGSINEGGELGYSLSHAYGAILDNPTLIAACVIGDGEAETGPLAASWNINKIIDPKTDGAVLPILHLNSYKIANPTIFGRMNQTEIESFFKGLGYKPYFIEGKTPSFMHENMAKILDLAIKDIQNNWTQTRKNNKKIKPKWPVIIVKTPKGWTGPKKINNEIIEDSFRSHQIPITINEECKENIKLLEKWLKSYHPEELFDENGKLKEEIKSILPKEELRMTNNPNANGGLLKELIKPDYKEYALDITTPGEVVAQDTKELGKYIRDLIKLNIKNNNYRIFGPDEAKSNRLHHVFEVTNKKWAGITNEQDELLSSDGKVIDMILSEHVCQGLLEGYLLTGRHGFMHSYEAFIRIVDSMASQHAKWLKVCSEIPWRKDISSLNYLLTSHIWQQDHNGYTHQDPGFLNHLATKKSEIVRMYLPPDTNCLLSCFDHCVNTKNYINVLVASKHPRQQWFNMEEASKLCEKGIGKIEFASTDNNKTPDVILACCGDTPTLETIAAAKILKEKIKNIKIRVISVIDLMKLESKEQHDHGLTQEEYNELFTKNKPIIFAFHGYPNLIHQLAYKRENKNLHVHGYQEEGTITTPFDMRVKNKLDRFNLVLSALKYLKVNEEEKEELIDWCNKKLKEHDRYIKKYGQDMKEIRNWKWED